MYYVPLWIKTDYSLLSSMIKIDELVDKLKKMGCKAAAICDDNMYGVMEFYDKCKKNDIKPIIGLELSLDYNILLYAKNYEGYQTLCQLDTSKSEGKLDKESLYTNLDNLLVVIPFKSIEKAKDIFNYSNDIFIGYETELEREKIQGKKVYIKKILTLNKEDEKYLPFLYKIKELEYNNSEDVTLLGEVSFEDMKNNSYLANLCNVEICKHSDLLPVFNEDKNFNEKKYLQDLCLFGLNKRLNGNIKTEYLKRLQYELKVIVTMGFCNYFLVVWDYVKFAKKNNILVGPGRGSAASSLVSYSLGITDIDPLKYDLLFERFLNPERITMPDIDIDFDAEKRNEVIEYVIGKYGKEKVSGIITFSNLLAKQVIRDLARIEGISNFKIDNLLKYFDDKKTLKEQLSNINVKRILSDDNELRSIYDVGMHLEGLKRHSSVHAAGIIISSKNLRNYVPLYYNFDGNYLCGYTMNYIEELGLLKMDFLGLKNLSLISKIMGKVGNINFNQIPLNDKKTFELFCSGNLDGIFQFESLGMRKFIGELKPDSIDDLIAAVALFRPGPIDNIPSYIKRKHGKEKITYLHQDLEGILKSTYGIIVYQEQIMQIASLMAGFSYGEADVLRRAMSKKKEDVLLEQKDKFIKGSLKKGYDELIANRVYELILKFANYGFNKAHSVSYAIIGYKIAYLKVHYPLAFMCEVLNNCIGINLKTKNAINECRMLNLKVIKPSINTSSCEYKISEGGIECAITAVKSVGTLSCRQIVSERSENGYYTSFLDFVKRNFKLGKDVITKLILAGLLDEFGYTRKTLVQNLENALNYAELTLDLDESLVMKPIIENYEEYTKEELAKQEEDLYGFYITNHPTNQYLSSGSITTNIISKYFDRNVSMVLYFEKKREISTKNGEKMMFITASDSYGMIELIMFPKTYQKYFGISFPGVYKISGKVEKRFSKMQIVLYNIEKV